MQRCLYKLTIQSTCRNVLYVLGDRETCRQRSGSWHYGGNQIEGKRKKKGRHWAHELQDGTIYKVTTVPFVAATTVYGIYLFPPTDFLILKKKNSRGEIYTVYQA